jgi:hypothetical protein
MAGRELQCANFEGERMGRKRRRRGNLPRVGGEGNTAEEEIGGEVGAPVVSSGGGGGAPVPARACRRGEVVRVEQGVVLPLYRAEGEEGRARRRWRGSSPVRH